MGRTFTAAEDGAPGDAPVAILSDGLWRRRYGADPSLIGGTVRINGVPLTVVGIMPADLPASATSPRCGSPGRWRRN
jgi:hypothetical protein